MLQKFSEFLTPLIAIITGSILVLQYFLAKRRWRLDLYDKRYPVYLGTMEYISVIMRDASVSMEELIKFLRNSKDKEFLFGKEIKEFLEELYKKGTEFHTVINLLKNTSMSENKRERLIEKQEKLLLWFKDQIDVSKKLFGKYLTIDKK
jgi:hypothetical protein